jgi:signal transduction histidine kinase
LNERLHDMEQSRRQLLANLVHELGRPLGAFHSGLQALTRGARQDPQLMDELLQGMDEEVSQLRRLLDDLSHLHDQVLGSLELDRRPIEFGKWLSQTVRPWQELARQQHLRWETSIPADLPVVEADPDRMGQVVGNLVNNAIKYTPSRGKVSISAGETPDRMVWLEVHDTGPGISPQEQDKIFEPFFRGEQKKRIKQGLGLGLSIARDLVIAHGGRIDIDSEPGLGTSFIVKIPISSDEMGPVNGSGQGVSA